MITLEPGQVAEVTITKPTRSAVGLRSERGPVLLSIMVSLSLVAIDGTILAAAVPSVVKDLGGFAQFPWLFSIYLLTQAVTVPLYGKFADVVGRKPLMQLGVVVFLVGSVLCGVAWSMPTLIAFRAVQGVGAGAVVPISLTIVGDLYTVEERARVQGYTASVWGAAAVIGPTLGGVFSQWLSWRWIFFVNLPLGAVAMVLLSRHLRERVERSAHSIDYFGATLLTIGCSLVILGLLQGGTAWAWRSAESIAVFTVGVVMLAAFIVVERRVVEPVLPLWVFGRRVLLGGSLAALGIGALAIGLASYLPTYVQGVLGTGPVVAGLALATFSIGWPLASTFAGRIYVRIGFRNAGLIGSGVVVVGAILCGSLTRTAAVWQVAGACFVVGVGLGLAATPSMVAVQSVVGWERRGVVTGTNMFCRSMGSAVGAAVFGAIANATFARRLAEVHGQPAGLPTKPADLTNLALDAGRHSTPAAVFARAALYDAAHDVFLALFAAAVFIAAAMLLMPVRIQELVFDD